MMKVNWSKAIPSTLFAVLFLLTHTGCNEKREAKPEPLSKPATQRDEQHEEKQAEKEAKMTNRVFAPDGKWSNDGAFVFVRKVLADTDSIRILVAVATVDPSKMIEYRSWGKALGKKASKLVDATGHVYPSKPLSQQLDTWMRNGLKEKYGPGWEYSSGPVIASKRRMDLLTFERPVASAEYADLDLDADHIGQTGIIQFRLPASMCWQTERVTIS